MVLAIAGDILSAIARSFALCEGLAFSLSAWNRAACSAGLFVETKERQRECVIVYLGHPTSPVH